MIIGAHGFWRVRIGGFEMWRLRVPPKRRMKFHTKAPLSSYNFFE